MELKKYIPLLKWILLIVLVALGGWYAYRHPDLFAALRNVSGFAIAAIAALVLLGRVLQSLQFHALCHGLGAEVGLAEAFGLVMCNSMYSLLAPGRAGLGVQAAYLKKKHGLSLAHFGSLVAVSNLLRFLLALGGGLAGCLIGLAAGVAVPPVLLMAFGALFGVCVVGFIVLPIAVRLGTRIPWDFLNSICERMEDGFRTLRGRKRLLLKIIVLGAVNVLLAAAVLLIACGAVGLDAGFLEALTMGGLARVGLLLPLTPGGLGITEGAVAAAGRAWGMAAETAMLAALVMRAVGVCIVFGFGSLFSYLLLEGVGISDSESSDNGTEQPNRRRETLPMAAISPQKILVTTVSGMGNMLLFTPALIRLRRRFPSTELDMLVEGHASLAIAESLLEVDHTFEVGYGHSLTGAFGQLASLRARRYDMNVTAFPSNDFRFNLLAAAVGARRRIAHSYPESSAINCDFLQTELVPARRGLHDIEQNLRLIAREAWGDSIRSKLPRPHLSIPPQDRTFACKYFNVREVGGPIIAVHPGSAADGGQRAKRWPANHFKTLISMLVDSGHSVLVFCGPDEKGLGKYLRESFLRAQASNVFFPRVPILRTAAMIERCDAMITNDSGLMHVATAVETPVVALFGPTDASRTAPPWEDCRVLKATESGRLGYPFTTTIARLRPLPDDYWKDLSPGRVWTEVKRLL
ncbi:MAG: glycosyltransferase family 9 protein [Candidatus Brocadiia bacterium]